MLEEAITAGTTVGAAIAVLRSDSTEFEPIRLSAERSIVVVGRSRSADYRIEHPQVSGLQCTLALSGGVLTLRDTSTNGTFVDGELVGKNLSIKLHDRSLVTLLVPSVQERDDEFGEGTIPSFKVEIRQRKPIPLPSGSPLRRCEQLIAAAGAAAGGVMITAGATSKLGAKGVRKAAFKFPCGERVAREGVRPADTGSDKTRGASSAAMAAVGDSVQAPQHASDAWRTGSARRPLRRARIFTRAGIGPSCLGQNEDVSATDEVADSPLLLDLSIELIAIIVCCLDARTTLALSASCARLATACASAVESLKLCNLAAPLQPAQLAQVLQRFGGLSHLSLAPSSLASPPLSRSSGGFGTRPPPTGYGPRPDYGGWPLAAAVVADTAWLSALGGVSALGSSPWINGASSAFRHRLVEGGRAAAAKRAASGEVEPAPELGVGAVLAAMLPSLFTLEVPGNCISAAGANTLADALCRLSTVVGPERPGELPRVPALPLKHLDLSETRLSAAVGAGAAAYSVEHPTRLLQALGKAPNLVTLRLGGNLLGAWAASALGHWLCTPACCLSELDISHNALADAGVEAVCKALRQNTSLTRLNLAENMVTDAGCRALEGLLSTEHAPNGDASGGRARRNITLTSLDLAWNGIEAQAAVALLKAVIAARRCVPPSPLARLRLDKNTFGMYYGYGPATEGAGMTSEQHRLLVAAVRAASEENVHVTWEETTAR